MWAKRRQKSDGLKVAYVLFFSLGMKAQLKIISIKNHLQRN